MVRPAVSPASCSSRLLKRLIELEIVFQLVSMPPSQRWLTKCWPERRAASAIGSCAWRLVPTNSTLPPAAAVWRTKSSARAKSGTVCDRSMMWTPLRSPKMYGFIFGFQRWVWWPKCAPASSNCCMVTSVDAMVFLLPVIPLRGRELEGPSKGHASTGMMAPHVEWARSLEAKPAGIKRSRTARGYPAGISSIRTGPLSSHFVA